MPPGLSSVIACSPRLLRVPLGPFLVPVARLFHEIPQVAAAAALVAAPQVGAVSVDAVRAAVQRRHGDDGLPARAGRLLASWSWSSK